MNSKMDERTFERHFKSLYRQLGMYALRILGDIATAEDVVQEAFAAVWTKLSQGTEIGAFRPYIYRVVHNAAMMRLRGQSVLTVSVDDLDSAQADEICRMTDTVSDEDIELSERDARLWEAVGKLPERCRQVLLMCKRDGLSYREVAEEMGITVKTVENQMNKALRTLRDSFGPERGSDRVLFSMMFF